MSRDVIAELRGQDPARRAHLDAVDPGALVALREGITMTDRGTTEVRNARAAVPARQGARRLGGRGALVGGLAVVLAGGGVAFAASQIWSDEEGAATNGMGIQCRELFDVGYPNEGATIAGTLTGDPVADCQSARAEEGMAPLVDPVAFEYDDALYVTPRTEVPAGADVMDVDAAQAAVIRELQASLGDVVDGGAARCLSADDAPAWVEGELARLGLTGWSVEVRAAVGLEGATCAELVVGEVPHTVQVLPDADVAVEGWLDETEIAAYRAIATSCLAVDAAYEAAVAAVGDQPHPPVVRMVDEAASCSRIDVEELGGGPQITVYGPTSVG